MLGAAETLKDLSDKLSESEKADLLATIIDESERLNRFIANLLDMTKLEAGAVVPNAALHDLGEIVGSALQRASKILARHRVEVDLPADLPMLQLDAVLFEQALFNLLDNAAKYAPAGTDIRIQSWRDRMRSACRSSTKERASPPAISSASSTSSIARRRAIRCAPGPGLGSPSPAASSRRCTARSPRETAPIGAGAVFTIRLPIPAETRTAGHRRMTAPALRVLVIDDEPPIRKLLRMGLSTQGYEILEAPNGKTALELLAENPDLVILDLGLPDMQGLELLRMMRARNESVPIVVLSSRGDEGGKVEALDLGADDYVTKPFGMDELLARMRAALRHQLQVHGERPVFRVGDLSVDLVRRVVKVRRRGGEALAQGIRPPARPGAARRQGADAQVPARGALGPAHRRAISARLCPPAATEDRGRSRAPAICPDGNRHRLSPARPGLNAGPQTSSDE